jgi:hypothetical protein
MNKLDFQLLEDQIPLESVTVMGADLKPGDQVRIKPNGRGDILDLALRGKIATIELIEHDYEDRIYLTVVVDDDPGKELGLRRHPGHRFFYSPEEVEPL